jgi:hypothetical protein
MNDRQSIASELLADGARLWSAVHCDVRGDRFLIYAELACADPLPSLPKALTESKQIVTRVLNRRLQDVDWLATVHWSGRMSFTFAPERRAPRR